MRCTKRSSCCSSKPTVFAEAFTHPSFEGDGARYSYFARGSRGYNATAELSAKRRNTSDRFPGSQFTVISARALSYHNANRRSGCVVSLRCQRMTESDFTNVLKTKPKYRSLRSGLRTVASLRPCEFVQKLM